MKLSPKLMIFGMLLLTMVPCMLYFIGVDYMLIVVVVTFLILVIACIQKFNDNIFFLAFLFSFFIFLVSGDLAEEIFHQYYWIRYDEQSTRHAHFCIWLSLVFLYIGFKFIGKVTLKTHQESNSQVLAEQTLDFDLKILSIRKAAKIIYFLSLPILLIETGYAAVYTLVNGYISYYVSYSSLLPSFISKFQDLVPIALCVFLATMPNKKESNSVLITYMIYVILGFLLGQRGTFVYNATFLLAYFIFRNRNYSDGEIWIKNRTIYIIVAILPISFAFLFVYEYIRSGTAFTFTSLGDYIIKFFVNLGQSSQIIKAGYMYADKIPKFRFYLLGDTLNYFQYGRIFHFLSTSSIPSAHSARYALESHSFDAIISYLTMNSDYLSGHGAGSCYIAVLYADFGYIGIALGNIIYGVIFAKISSIRISEGWVKNALKLFIMLFMFRAPRGSFDSFFAEMINVFFIFGMLLIYSLSSSIKKSISEKNNINSGMIRY